MDYKVFKAKIITGGRTIEQVEKEFKDDDSSPQDYENMKLAYDHFDGAVAIFRLWNHSKDVYYLAGWEDRYNEQIMKGMYYAEQTNPFGAYQNVELEIFIADWMAGECDSNGAFALKANDLDIIEKMEVTS